MHSRITLATRSVLAGERRRIAAPRGMGPSAAPPDPLIFAAALGYLARAGLWNVDFCRRALPAARPAVPRATGARLGAGQMPAGRQARAPLRARRSPCARPEPPRGCQTALRVMSGQRSPGLSPREVGMKRATGKSAAQRRPLAFG